MERLTSNKPVDEMSMVELAYNACYAENRKATYRDFETIMDARDFARILYEAYVNEELPTDDDEFDSIMIDDLQYEPTIHANGLIALFYRNLWAMADLREKLKYYEDAEEQGLLLRLPCNYNDTLYWIVNGNIREVWFKGIRCDKGYKPQIIARYLEGLSSKEAPITKLENIGKTVFLTKEEAEQALAERKNDE